MKRLLRIIKQEEAFYFPFVLMITIIVLSAISTSIIIYRNELITTKQIIHQVEAETIVQMARKQFLNSDVHNQQEKGEVIYNFPSGSATIKYESVDQHEYFLHVIVLTNKQFQLESSVYLMVQSK